MGGPTLKDLRHLAGGEGVAGGEELLTIASAEREVMMCSITQDTLLMAL